MRYFRGENQRSLQNTGNNNLLFAPQIMQIMDADGHASPSLCDIDSDSDYDLFITSDERLWYFQNIGSAQLPEFELISDSLPQIIWYAVGLDLIDIDADGDFDLFTGDAIGTIRFYRNQGTQLIFNFIPEAYIFNNIDVGEYSDPVFIDIDADGDLDLFIGNEAGYIYFYRNDGDSVNYNFTFVTNNYNSIFVERYASPEFADIDGDADYDLFVGRDNQFGYNPGDIFFYRNIGTPQVPQWQFVTKNYISLDEGDVAHNVSTDIDADGDYDLFIANHGYTISFFRNIGTASSPFFQWVTGSYQNIWVDSNLPCFCDIDNDGDPDLFIGEGVLPNPPYPGLHYFQNIGTPRNAQFSLITNNLIPYNYNVFIGPSLADINADGDDDIFLSDIDGIYYYCQNTGTPIQPSFATPIPDWQGISTGHITYYCFYDIDHDGDLDLFGAPVSYQDNQLWFFRNTGTPQAPNFILETQTFIPMIGSNIHEFNWPDGLYITDIDNDGDGDFFFGTANRGGCYFFRNVTGDTSAVPLPGTAPARPCKTTLSIGPNPSNPITAISFELRATSFVNLAVYDIMGRKVTTLVSGKLSAGEHNITWDATGNASGVYLIQLLTPQEEVTKKIIVMK